MNILPIEQDDLKEICICEKRYSIEKKIASGGFGTVYEAFLKNNKYAIKQMKLDPNQNLKALIVELGFVHNITRNEENHLFPIVKIFDYEYIEKENALYYVMELGTQSLDKYFRQIRKFEDIDKINAIYVVFSYILKSLLYFETIDATHRDIKPQNFIILNDNSNRWGYNIKLIDFGTVRILGEKQETMTPHAGTLPYMAPEILNDITSKKSDIWSLGIILFELINDGELPEHAKSAGKTLLFARSKENVYFPNCKSIFTNIQDVTKNCLVKNYKERKNATEIYQYTKESYKHDSILQYYFEKIISETFLETIEKIKQEKIVKGKKKI